MESENNSIWIALSVVIPVLVTLISGLFWLAYRLGQGDTRISRNKEDIKENKKTADEGLKNLGHEMKVGFDKVYQKIDDLPCHSPNWASGRRPDGC